MGDSCRAGAGPQAGFTLVEVVVALALLAIVMTTVFRLQSSALLWLARADEGERAAIIADGLLAQLGIGQPLRPGERTAGRAGDYLWTIETAPYAGTEPAGPRPDRLVQVRIAVGSPGRPAFELVTLRLASGPPP